MVNIKKLYAHGIFYLVLFSSQHVIAQSCSKGSLTLEIYSQPNHHNRLAHLWSKLEMPNTNYSYSLIAKELGIDNMARWALVLKQKRPGLMTKQVITPLILDEEISIPNQAEGLFIEVEKSFSGSPEYFSIKFLNTTQKIYCLSPEMYK